MGTNNQEANYGYWVCPGAPENVPGSAGLSFETLDEAESFRSETGMQAPIWKTAIDETGMPCESAELASDTPESSVPIGQAEIEAEEALMSAADALCQLQGRGKK